MIWLVMAAVSWLILILLAIGLACAAKRGDQQR